MGRTVRSAAMRRLFPLLLIVAIAIPLAGCGGGDGNASKACSPPPTATPGGVTLPASFPVPTGVTMISSTKDGPTAVLAGYSTASLDDLYTQYKEQLNKPPFQVTKSEKDDHDAEINFESAESTGQVKLADECTDRVSVHIPVRPK